MPQGRVLPHDFAQRELTRHVGAVVIIMAELDSTMTALASMASGEVSTEDIRRFWGQSGKPLAERIRKAAPSDQKLVDIALRYEELYDIRNHIIHSFRPPPDDTHHGGYSLKPQKPKKGELMQPEAMFDRRAIGVREMIDTWYKAQDLKHDALQVYFDKIFDWQQRNQ